ncbi:hypothetical protein HK101_008270 [Irineochytrium annulatum]|nr:hypothetical protein HK101_008270 [Irineochytrium annulatum]
MALYWAVGHDLDSLPPGTARDRPRNDAYITFALETDLDLNVTSWISLGLSEMGGMRGADMFVLQRMAVGGPWSVTDMHSTGYWRPTRDKVQDLVMMGEPASVTAQGTSMFAFRRGVSTCDEDDREIRVGEIQNLIWAYGSGNLSYHGDQRGTVRISLYPNTTSAPTTSTPTAPLPSTTTLNITVANFTLPVLDSDADPDVFACVRFSLPADRKYHVIDHAAILTTQLARRATIYSCVSPPISTDPAEGQTFRCGRVADDCLELAFGWESAAPIAQTLAEHDAGIPFGLGERTHFLLRVQYRRRRHMMNVSAMQGPSEPDNSGVSLAYTSILRAHDVGFLTLGSVFTGPGLKLDEASPSTSAANRCPAACTRRMSSGGLAMPFGVAMEMHGLGQSGAARHVRDGVEVAPVGEIGQFEYGSSIMAGPGEPGKMLMPGDAILTSCSYAPTKGLKDSDSEVCIAYVPVIPKPKDVEVCLTFGKTSYAFCSTHDARAAAGSPWSASFFERLMTSGCVSICERAPETDVTGSRDVLKVNETSNYTSYSSVCNASINAKDQWLIPTSSGPTTNNPSNTTTPLPAILDVVTAVSDPASEGRRFLHARGRIAFIVIMIIVGAVWLGLIYFSVRIWTMPHNSRSAKKGGAEAAEQLEVLNAGEERGEEEEERDEGSAGGDLEEKRLV